VFHAALAQSGEQVIGGGLRCHDLSLVPAPFLSYPAIIAATQMIWMTPPSMARPGLIATSPASGPYRMAPTARAMISRLVSSAAVACTLIKALARVVRGMVSVGLNALELVTDT
jgi:hypothetical protein